MNRFISLHYSTPTLQVNAYPLQLSLHVSQNISDGIITQKYNVGHSALIYSLYSIVHDTSETQVVMFIYTLAISDYAYINGEASFVECSQ